MSKGRQDTSKMKQSIDGVKGAADPNHLDLTQKKAGEAQSARTLKMPKISKKLIGVALAAAVILLGVWTFATRSLEPTNDDVIGSISGLVSDLPNGNPTIATVENVDELIMKDPFYEGAKNGDKVVVYPQSNRAIIYRPDTNAIIKDGGVSVPE